MRQSVSKKLLSNFKRFYKIRLVNKIYVRFEFRPVSDVKYGWLSFELNKFCTVCCHF